MYQLDLAKRSQKVSKKSLKKYPPKNGYKDRWQMRKIMMEQTEEQKQGFPRSFKITIRQETNEKHNT